MRIPATVLGCLLAVPAAAQQTFPADVPPQTEIDDTAADDSHTDLAIAVRAFVEVTDGGLTDDALASAAIARAPAMTSAALSIDALRASRSEAMVAAYPNLTLEASYTRLSRIDTDGLEFGGVSLSGIFDQPLNRGLFRATLRLPLTQAILQVLPGLEAADFAIEAAEIRTEIVRRQLDLETRLAFYEYVRMRSQAQVADDAVAQLQALRNDVTALVARELRPSADLAEIDAGIAQADLERTRLIGGIEIARRSLERLTGLTIPPDAPIGTAALRITQAGVTDHADAFNAALAQRPELRALRAAQGANDAQLRVSRANRYPSLDIIGTADLANPNDRYIPAETVFNESWAVTVAASWSPNRFRASQFADRQIQADMATLDADIAGLEDQLFMEVNQALIERQIANDTLRAATVGADAARVAYDAAVMRNRAGLGTAREVLDAETALRRAQNSVVNARLQTLVTAMRLQWSLGESL